MRAAMVTTRLPLNSLRFLQAVAQHGSMARAAEALNVEPSAVSMQLKALADYVGAPLVVKARGGVELTPLARRLLPPVAAGLAQIEQSLRAARQAAREQPFVISLLPSFLLLCLVPHLDRLEAAAEGHPLVLTASKSAVAFGASEADAAVRLGAGSWPGTQASKLADEYLVPVCAPALRGRGGDAGGRGTPRRCHLAQQPPRSMGALEFRRARAPRGRGRRRRGGRDAGRAGSRGCVDAAVARAGCAARRTPRRSRAAHRLPQRLLLGDAGLGGHPALADRLQATFRSVLAG
jgi:DNA-binding transcriptional LysR family regulator